MTSKLSSNQIFTIEAIKAGSIRHHFKSNSYYVMVPSSVRRNCRMKIPKSTINALVKNGIITLDMQLTEFGKSFDL